MNELKKLNKQNDKETKPQQVVDRNIQTNNQEGNNENAKQESNTSNIQKIVDQRIKDIFEQVKSDGAKLTYINSPINGKKQSSAQKKLNTMKYWEMVDAKEKKKMHRCLETIEN
jgi:hypothetical protein